MTQPTVILVRTSNFAWQGLWQALGKMPGLQRVGQAHSAERALDLVGRLRPDIIVTGVLVEGGLSPMALLTAFRHRSPGSRLVVMMDSVGQVDRDELVAIQRLGIEAQLLWGDVIPERFHHCLQAIVEGNYTLASRGLATAAFDADPQLSSACSSPLSARECEVLRLMVLGNSDQEIATQLGLSVDTIPSHVRRIRAKVGARNRNELCYRAGQLGLPFHSRSSQSAH